MHYCGLDVATKSTHVHIENEQGRRVKRTVVATTPEGLTRALEPYARRGLRVALEAGGHTAWICDVLRELAIGVHVVHPLKVKWIAESKKKTDRVDAQLLAYLLRIGGLPEPVHIPSRRSRQLRGLLLGRRQWLRTRTRLINVIRGLVRQEQITLKARALNTRAGWGALRTAPLAATTRAIVAQYEQLLTALGAALKALDQELAGWAQRDERIARLTTIPGVGTVSAQTLVAAVDRIERVASSKKLVAYAGLAPTVRASGERVEHGPITKQGRAEIRAVWVQAAHSVLIAKTADARPRQRWGERLARRRGRKTAVVALARKLLTIAFHLLREGTVYAASRLSRVAA